MVSTEISQVKKRNKEVVLFNPQKICDAIFRAAKSVGGRDYDKAKELTRKIVAYLENKGFSDKVVPNVEDVQDAVEKILIEEGHAKTAKAFIIYREQHKRLREFRSFVNSNDIMDGYLRETDWRVKENSNMAYSLQGLNNHISSIVSSNYWLHKVYPPEIRDAHVEGDFHLHDLQILASYCCGWDLQDLLIRGFGGVSGKLQSAPPKHLRAALGQVTNFVYTLQGECYSEDTEVLTEEGWKYFYDVKKVDKVFTRNNRGVISLHKPLRFFKYKRSQELYNFRTKKLDLLVTPEHSMLVWQYFHAKKDNSTKFVKANEFNPNTNWIPKVSIWKTKDKANFVLPGIEIRQYQHFGDKYVLKRVGPKKIPMDVWLAFFGFWIAEGCLYKRERKREGRKKVFYEYAVRITQNKGKVADSFENILSKLPFNYNKKIVDSKKLEFVICDKQLFSYLEKFGKAGDKFLPNDVKSLSSRQLKILFDWMMNGDGYIANGNVEYSTKSRRLADDFQEVVLKLGWNANIYERKKGKFRWYDIGVSRTKYFRLSKSNIKKVRYSGNVYCLEVPNHTLYVRRNGKACWCGNCAGAQAFSGFDTFLAPFVRYDNLSYKEVKQAMQEFLFNMNVPTRVGFQCPFSNITLDLKCPKALADKPVIIGGKPNPEKYGEFQKEMEMINRAFAEVMMAGDANGRIFTFPIPTYNVTKDLDWDNPEYDIIWEMTARYGMPYFANFVNSDMDPDDARSMCCRLRLDNREIRRKGGVFGAHPLTGSLGVVTLNLPRIGYLSENEDEFMQRLFRLMDLASLSLEIKRKSVEKFTEFGLYPYAKHYLSGVKQSSGSYWSNHFNTIGILGMNEACLNLFGKSIASEEGRKFALRVMGAMLERIADYQKKTGNNYNLEATPAEGATYRLAKADKSKFQDIITAGEGEPYYTNSTHLPVNYTDDIFEALQLQDEIQSKYTGGTVLHGFLGERIDDIQTCKALVRKIATNFKLPYFTLTPTFSICPVHGYVKGEHFECPHEHTEEQLKMYGIVRDIKGDMNV
ncbi:MAG: ribonucleoside triphosphate reductase [archaeon]